MARIRTIKPDFWKHEGLSELPEATHMLAAALLNYADDEGYFNANAKLIQAETSPLREPSVSIHTSLKHLAKQGYVRLGTGNDGRRYGHIVAFEDHQVINRKTDSKIKLMEIVWDESVSTHGVISEPSVPEGKGREGNKEGKGTVEFDEWWKWYPRKVAKGDALKAYKAASKKTDTATLLAGAKRYAEECRGKEATYIAHPATWLNAERWLDEPAKVNGTGYSDTTESTMKIQAKAIAATGRSIYSVSDHDARQMVKLGLLTDEQARKAGYAA